MQLHARMVLAVAAAMVLAASCSKKKETVVHVFPDSLALDEVIATVNAALHQQVEIVGPGVEVLWSGTGEGKRIGHTVIEFPPGAGDVSVDVSLTFAAEDDSWAPSHETVIDQKLPGELGMNEIQILGEDGQGSLDGNDVVVRFRWVL